MEIVEELFGIEPTDMDDIPTVVTMYGKMPDPEIMDLINLLNLKFSGVASDYVVLSKGIEWVAIHKKSWDDVETWKNYIRHLVERTR